MGLDPTILEVIKIGILISLRIRDNKESDEGKRGSYLKLTVDIAYKDMTVTRRKPPATPYRRWNSGWSLQISGTENGWIPPW